MTNRRHFTLGSVCLAALGLGMRSASAQQTASFEVRRSDAEWRRLLTPEQFGVLRQSKTERAGSSPLDRERRAGIFHCAGCDLPLFSSAAKYDSGTGWPSFWQPLDNAIGTKQETGFLFVTQTEVHCRRCGGHLGHVFDDGPPPTGKRYCMNGVAMNFIPA
ncbi:MAG TPA: peptide-methionine (R)-S-oxide reductase MsrB [Reyranellaceae bacterium]|nr:peptide-methionine (R)-S-oxide reductase MsrB [Reyranellaceae bacterium]